MTEFLFNVWVVVEIVTQRIDVQPVITFLSGSLEKKQNLQRRFVKKINKRGEKYVKRQKHVNRI